MEPTLGPIKNTNRTYFGAYKEYKQNLPRGLVSQRVCLPGRCKRPSQRAYASTQDLEDPAKHGFWNSLCPFLEARMQDPGISVGFASTERHPSPSELSNSDVGIFSGEYALQPDSRQGWTATAGSCLKSRSYLVPPDYTFGYPPVSSISSPMAPRGGTFPTCSSLQA